MNIVSAQQKRTYGWRRSDVSTLVDDVTRRTVPSPMLTRGGSSSESVRYSTPRCSKDFEDDIETIDGYENVPLVSYRTLQRENTTLKERMKTMEVARDELQIHKKGRINMTMKN